MVRSKQVGAKDISREKRQQIVMEEWPCSTGGQGAGEGEADGSLTLLSKRPGSSNFGSVSVRNECTASFGIDTSA